MRAKLSIKKLNNHGLLNAEHRVDFVWNFRRRLSFNNRRLGYRHKHKALVKFKTEPSNSRIRAGLGPMNIIYFRIVTKNDWFRLLERYLVTLNIFMYLCTFYIKPIVQ